MNQLEESAPDSSPSVKKLTGATLAIVQTPYTDVTKKDISVLHAYIDRMQNASVKADPGVFMTKIVRQIVSKSKLKLATVGHKVRGVNDTLTAIEEFVEHATQNPPTVPNSTEPSVFITEKIAYINVCRSNPLAVYVHILKNTNPDLTPDELLIDILNQYTLTLGLLPEDPLYEHRKQHLSEGKVPPFMQAYMDKRNQETAHG